jgi:hypothetical protein
MTGRGFLGDYPRVRRVESFEELVSSEFIDGVNAFCWERVLEGDFAEVASLLATDPAIEEGITRVEEERLLALPLSAAGRLAVEALLADQQLLRSRELEPGLDFINGSLRDLSGAPVATHVYSFHADSATAQADTYLCTYHGAASEGLRNEDAVRHVDIPETRARLLDFFGGEDGPAFQEYLSAHFFDLHYAPVAGARPFGFGCYNLWRIAVQYPGSPVPPCVHRAPETRPGDIPRLLLIS